MHLSNLKQKKKQLEKVHFPKICIEISEKLDIPLENVQKVVCHFWLTFNFFINTPFLPRIYIKNFGTFGPHRRRIRKRFVKCFSDYFGGKISKSEFETRRAKFQSWLNKADDDRRGRAENSTTIKDYWKNGFFNYVKNKRKNNLW